MTAKRKVVGPPTEASKEKRAALTKMIDLLDGLLDGYNRKEIIGCLIEYYELPYRHKHDLTLDEVKAIQSKDTSIAFPNPYFNWPR